MQFGPAFEGILCAVWEADPTHCPVFLLKIDLSDGSYWSRLVPEDLAGLCVVFPVAATEEPLAAFPLVVLPMGWTESPSHFCSTTKTVVDIANGLFIGGLLHLLLWKRQPPLPFLLPNTKPCLCPHPNLANSGNLLFLPATEVTSASASTSGSCGCVCRR